MVNPHKYLLLSSLLVYSVRDITDTTNILRRNKPTSARAIVGDIGCSVGWIRTRSISTVVTVLMDLKMSKGKDITVKRWPRIRLHNCPAAPRSFKIRTTGTALFMRTTENR